MTPTADNSLRQAAAFVHGLAPDAAQAMLCRLSSGEASALRSAIAEFDADQNTTRQAAHSEDGTVELQLGTTAKEPVSRAPAVTEMEPTEPPFDGAKWLRSLEEADPKAIASYLSHEHPRAIAVVLSYLPARLAAGVLQSLDSDEQSRVVAQLADQGDADEDSLRMIASGLAEWLQTRREEAQRRSNRVATIREILAATPASKREHLLAGLSASEPDVAAALAASKSTSPSARAEEPAPRRMPDAVAPVATIPFDQLHRVDSRTLSKGVAGLDSRTALLALAGASEVLLAKLTHGLGRHAARDLRARLHRVGPTTLSEIDRSQAALAASVSRLVAERSAARSATKVGA